MVSEQEKIKFEKICHDIIHEDRQWQGIGTCREKTLHRVLKKYLCPNTDFHETMVGTYIADIVYDNTIYEIQSAGLFPLKRKLAYYLAHTDKQIQIVCPVLTCKRVIWVDTESGEMSKPRKSPVGHGKMRVLPELIYLLDVLDFDRISFVIVGINADDYKLLDGKSGDKKHGATRLERLPQELTDLVYIHSKKEIADYFMPQNLPSVFTAAEFSRLTKLRRRTLSAALKVLVRLDIIQTDGKQGNAILYRWKNKKD
jgi:hypothetical protein